MSLENCQLLISHVSGSKQVLAETRSSNLPISMYSKPRLKRGICTVFPYLYPQFIVWIYIDSIFSFIFDPQLVIAINHVKRNKILTRTEEQDLFLNRSSNPATFDYKILLIRDSVQSQKLEFQFQLRHQLLVLQFEYMYEILMMFETKKMKLFYIIKTYKY